MSEKQERSLLQKVTDVDPRIIYTLILLVVSAVIIHPLGLPLPISKPTRDLHNIVMQLKPGDRVMVWSDESAHGIGETGPAWIVFMQDLFRRPGVKVVFSAAGGFVPETPTIFDTIIMPPVDKIGKKYGVDYVNLGWTPGFETAMASFATDIHKLNPRDHAGTPIDELPLMRDIKSIADFELLVYVGGGSQAQVMRQIFVPSGKPSVQIGMAVHQTGAMPYYPQTIKAYVFGLAQGAEYEKLIEKPGKAIIASDAISLSQLLLIILLFIGNIAYFLQRSGGMKK